MNRVVLAYSGGLDTSVAIPWMSEKYQAEIITVTVDLGQGRDLEAVRDRALAAGAARAHVLDLREEFARDFILPALKADALYEDRYPLATALGWPLIALKLVAVADIEEARGVAHGCSRTGSDASPLEATIRVRNPALTVLAPAAEWNMTVPERMEYANHRGIPVPAIAAGAYTTDANLWGRSIGCGMTDDPWREPTEDVYTLTKSGLECPNEPAYVELSFERGTPTGRQEILGPSGS